jgi:hypothetical protein
MDEEDCKHERVTVEVTVDARYEVNVHTGEKPVCDPYLSEEFEAFAESASCTDCDETWDVLDDIPEHVKKAMQTATESVEALLPGKD